MKRTVFKTASLLVAFAASTAARAQEASSSDPAGSALSGLPSAGLPGGASVSAKGPTWLTWGSLRFRPRIGYGLAYADGLTLQPGVPTTSYIQTFSSSVSAELGDNVAGDYAADWTAYSNPDFKDSFGQHAGGNVNLTIGKAAVRISENYTESRSPLVETGRQTTLRSSHTVLSGQWQVGVRTLVDIAGNADLQFVEAAPDPMDFSAIANLRYKMSNRLVGSIGTTAGYTAIDPGPDMTYLRPTLQANWQPSTRLGLGLSAGSETRKFYGRAGATAMTSPNFGLSVKYEPFENTSIDLQAQRGVSTSYFINQLTRSESWTASLHQRFFGHFDADVSYRSLGTRYVSSGFAFTPREVVEEIVDEEGNIGVLTTTSFEVNGVTIRRRDALESLSAGLAATFLKRVSLTVRYDKTRNVSNAIGFGMKNTQYTFRAGLAF